MSFRRHIRAVTSLAFALPLLLSGFAALAQSSSGIAAPGPVRIGGVQINTEENVPQAGDFTFGPSRFALSLAPGEERTVQVQVLSRTGRGHSFVFETEDFAAGTDGKNGTTLFGVAAGPYPARTWMRPAVPSLDLAHGQRAFIPVTIRVPNDAEPGDHYAALLLKRTLGPDETTDKGFNIVSRVGVLFLITVEGPIIQDARLLSLTSRSKLYWFFPAFFQLSARNDGTVYAAPTGTIVIRNILGLTVDEIPVKDWVVLRNSSRTLALDWRPRFALGRYTAATDLLMFGEKAKPVSVSFWVLPALPVLAGLFLIFLVSFLVQYFFSRFEIHKKSR